MDPNVEASIRQAAQEDGIDPAFALAVAERESNGNPNAHASRTIHGIFQMSGPLRAQYGGNSDDPYDQAKGWGAFMNATKASMAQRLGRDPTNDELYLAHHFGEGRAAGMITGRIPGSTATSDVFTPNEMSLNPHFGQAGTVGRLTSSISADMDHRQAKFGGDTAAPAPGIDFAEFGVMPGQGAGNGGSNLIDFAQFGVAPGANSAPKVQPFGLGANQDASTGPANGPASARPGTEVDLSQFGVAA